MEKLFVAEAHRSPCDELFDPGLFNVWGLVVDMWLPSGGLLVEQLMIVWSYSTVIPLIIINK